MRVTLTINNSYSEIAGLTLDQMRKLQDVLSYKIDSQAVYFSGTPHTRRLLIDKKGIFPTGLLKIVREHLTQSKIPGYEKDLRQRPFPLKTPYAANLPVTPYKEQEEAVKAALKAHHGILTMPTGTGKSIAMVLLVKALNVKTLIIVPNLELKAQLTTTFKQIFADTSTITIENIDSKALKTAKDYDCLIIDEAHHSAASTYRKLNKTAWTGIYYRFFFTATPFRSRDEEQLLMESITGGIIYTLTYKTAVERGLIVPVEAYYIELPKREVKGYTWNEVYKELVVNNDYRNRLISDMMKTLHENNTSALCLVKEIAHGNNLIAYTGGAFANGQDEECASLIKWFNEGKLKTLVGTTGVVGEGVDTKPCEYVIIAGLGKSKNQFMQQAGRGVRRYGAKESCKVVLFYDKSHRWTKAHFRAQVKFLLDEYGIKPVKLY